MMYWVNKAYVEILCFFEQFENLRANAARLKRFHLEVPAHDKLRTIISFGATDTGLLGITEVQRKALSDLAAQLVKEEIGEEDFLREGMRILGL